MDCLILPGGRGRIAEVQHPRVLNFIYTQAVHCQYVLSICTGAFLACAAGLINKNYFATTYWMAATLPPYYTVNFQETPVNLPAYIQREILKNDSSEK